jgi:GalNAc-alpha-(1->4)-GalNAc-alpha-(1->3)-diNAcBac-PP-undecaprenol alpha-1,4-N-acetyl-D-galactosaminyltransferase
MAPKILFVIKKINYGGASKMMVALANRLAADGYEVSLLTYEGNGCCEGLAPGINKINRIPITPERVAYRRLEQIGFVRSMIKQNRPDIVLSFLTYPNLISIIGLFGLDIPLIISERGDPYANRGWFTVMRDFLYRYADGYVFQTSAAKKYYHRRIQEKAAVIPNPILADVPTRWIGPREDVIVSVGRFELKQKRQDLLIQAFSRVVSKYPKIKLVLYGDGEDEPEIRRIIDSLNLRERVVLAGVTTNILESINKAKMFVLSSDYEGMPNALIEALCSGLPCISTDYSPGGADELIANKVDGLLVRPGSVEELAEAMEYFLEHPTIAEEMGQKAAENIRKLEPQTIFDQWKKYINQHVPACAISVPND